MRNKYTVIASAFRSSLEMNTNLGRHEIAMQGLISRNICDFKTVIGVSQEEGSLVPSREISLVITDLRPFEVTLVKDYYLNAMKQDCVLIIDQSNNEALLTGNGWSKFLGTYQKVTQAEAYESGFYTLDTNGQYWIVK